MAPVAVTFTEDELDVLRGIVAQWIDDGFTVPPYTPVEYALFARLSIRQDNVIYDITPPTAQ